MGADPWYCTVSCGYSNLWTLHGSSKCPNGHPWLVSAANIHHQGIPWIVVAVGAGVFGFSFTLLADVSLSYLMDCYQNVRLIQTIHTKWQMCFANMQPGRRRCLRRSHFHPQRLIDDICLLSKSVDCSDRVGEHVYCGCLHSVCH